MRTIDLSFVINKLDGTPLPGIGGDTTKQLTAGTLLGNNLVAGTNGKEALKFYDWAVAMTAGKPIVVDNSDFKKIYDFVENDQMNILCKAQIIRYLDSVKDSE